MPKTCCIAGCKSNDRSALKCENVQTFQFPKDPDLRNRWMRSINNEKLSISSNTVVCSKHFDESEIIMSEFVKDKTGKIREYPLWQPKLKQGTVPHIFPRLHNTSILQQLKGRNGQSSELEKDIQKNKESSNSAFLKKVTKQMVPLKSESPSELHFGEPEELEEISSNHMCRLCLECVSDTVPFFSVITFDDGSCLDVSKTYQELTNESDDRISDHNLPCHICKICIDLLVNAHNFFEIYRKTRPILESMVRQKIKEEDLDVTVHQQRDIEINKKKCDENEGAFAECSSAIKFEFGELSAITDSHTDDQSQIQADIDELLAQVSEWEEPPAESRAEAVPKVMFHDSIVVFHMCPICFKTFTALDLKKHCRSHRTLNSYITLGPRFNKKVKFYATPKLDRVSVFNKEGSTVSCPFCLKELEVSEFMDHMEHHKTTGNFGCNLCGRMFLRKSHLKLHQISHRKEAPFNCTLCSKPFFEKANFTYHVLRHHTQDNHLFTCSYCEKSFSHPKLLKRHLFFHKKSISYGTNFTKNGEQNQTMNTQVLKRKRKLEPVVCYVCGKTFTNIEIHLTTHGLRTDLMRTCPHCAREFSSQGNLTRHINAVHLKLHQTC